MKKVLFSALLVAGLGVLLSSCTKYKDQRKAVSGFAKVYCDESFKNILEQEIQIFQYQYPQSDVMARYMSESAALDSLLNDNVDLIITQSGKYGIPTSVKRQPLRQKKSSLLITAALRPSRSVISVPDTSANFFM